MITIPLLLMFIVPLMACGSNVIKTNFKDLNSNNYMDSLKFYDGKTYTRSNVSEENSIKVFTTETEFKGANFEYTLHNEFFDDNNLCIINFTCDSSEKDNSNLYGAFISDDKIVFVVNVTDEPLTDDITVKSFVYLFQKQTILIKHFF